MKKTLLITFGAIFALAGSTFASGEVTSGSTLTGTVLTGTVLTGTTNTGSTTSGTVLTGSTTTGSINTGMCINSGAMVRNDALVAISLAYTDSLKAATVKLKAAIDVAKASGKTDAEIRVMVSAAFDVWKTDMRSARKVMSIAKNNARKAFEATKKGCKEIKKRHWDDHKNHNDRDDDKNDDRKSKNDRKSEDDSHKSSGHSESNDDKGGSKNRGKSGR